MSEINRGNILTGVKIMIVDGVPDHLEMYKLGTLDRKKAGVN